MRCYIPLTAWVIWKQLRSYGDGTSVDSLIRQTEWRRPGSNLQPLVFKSCDITLSHKGSLLFQLVRFDNGQHLRPCRDRQLSTQRKITTTKCTFLSPLTDILRLRGSYHFQSCCWLGNLARSVFFIQQIRKQAVITLWGRLRQLFYMPSHTVILSLPNTCYGTHQLGPLLK